MDKMNIIKLSEIRKARGFSQTRFASAMGTTSVTVCRWEKGYNEPSISDVIRMCALLNVSADELLGIKKFNA